MSMTLKLNIVQNSQNVTGNSSNVTVSATATWDARHWNASGLCTGSITIDGTTYSFSGMSFNTNATSSGSQTVMTKTVDVKHLENGSKTLVCGASFDTRVSVGVISASALKNLTTIARKATLTETPSLTLGEQGTLKISNPSTDIARIVTYVCRTASGLILDEPGKYANSIDEGIKASETEISWTPPIDLASIDPTSEYASITITIESILDSSGHGQYDTSLGTNTYYIKAKVPDSVAPTVNSISVYETATDPTLQYIEEAVSASSYSYLQSASVLKVSIAASGSYGSTIQSYSTTIGGVTYTGSEFLVDTSNLSGTVEINTTVIDNRGSSGRKAAGRTSVSIMPYSPPKITSFTAVRANSDCTANSNGDYMLYRFTGTYANTFPNATCTIRYKKQSETEWIKYTSYTTTGGVLTEDGTEDVIGPLEQSAYDIQVEIADGLNSVSQTITGPTTAPIIHFNKNGSGVAFGKASEKENAVEFANPVYANDVTIDNKLTANEADTKSLSADNATVNTKLTANETDTKTLSADSVTINEALTAKEMTATSLTGALLSGCTSTLSKVYLNFAGTGSEAELEAELTNIYKGLSDFTTVPISFAGVPDGLTYAGFLVKINSNYGFLIASTYQNNSGLIPIVHKSIYLVDNKPTWRPIVSKRL